MDPKTKPYPVWGTQGGGLVRSVGETYIFVEKPPDFPWLDVGDEMPPEWGTIPANDLAREEMMVEEWGGGHEGLVPRT